MGPHTSVRCRPKQSYEGKSELRNASCNLWLPHGFLQVNLSFRTCNVRGCLETNSTVRHYYYYYYYYYYPPSLLRSSSAGSQNSTVSLTKHFLLNVLPITANCTEYIIILIITITIIIIINRPE